MASSAASALPAWGNRWERGLDANGSPTRSYVRSTTTNTTDHYREHTTTGWPRRSFRGISIGPHESHHDLPPRVSSFFRAVSKVSHDVRPIPSLDRASRLDDGWIVARSIDCLAKSPLSVAVRRIALCGSRATSCHPRYCAPLLAGHLETEWQKHVSSTWSWSGV